MSFRPISVCTATAVACTALMSGLPSRAEDVASIIKKVSDRYLKAKTYQGVIMTHQSMAGAKRVPQR